MPVKTVIVDDEAPAREELSWLLGKLDWVEIVGEADNARDALALVLGCSPQLVFLDVQMPGKSGIELCREFAQLPVRPQVVFTTAYDKYALEAFEVNALDYVLKPYNEARVWKAAHKARLAIEAREAQSKVGGAIERLAVRKDDKVFLLPYKDVDIAYADGRDVLVAAKGVHYKSDLSLQELEEKLASHNFFRCHRSFLVNLDKIREVSTWFNGGYALRLDGFSQPVVVSRKQAKEFRDRIGI